MAEMMRLKPEDILKRHDIALRKKEDFRDLYDEAYEFALPQRNLYDGYYDGKVGGAKKMNRVFDATAINSTQRFANRLQSGIFPPQRKWCRLETGPDIPEDRKAEASAALDIYADKMFATLKQSNFDIAMGEFLLDLAVGTAVMMVQPGDDTSPINFIPVPQFLVAFEEGANGQVDNVYRRMRIKGEAIIQQWRDATIPSDLQQKIDQKPTEDFELIEATVFDPKRGDFCYHVIHKESKQELVYRRLKKSPWVVSRYMKVAGEIYGRGPLITALPDIKTLNKTLELVLKNASLAISGVYTAADDGVLNPASAKMSARSATEVVERMKELSQNLGSAFGRLINETMIPLVSKILQVMDDRGIIDMPLRVNGLEVKVAPVAPLAMAQNMEDVTNVMQFVQMAQGFGPEGQATPKMGEITDYIADKLGIPSRLRNDSAERQYNLQQIAQQASQVAEQNPEAVPEMLKMAGG